MAVTCFKGRTGADGQHLIGFGGGDKLTEALDELLVEGTVVSHRDTGYGEPVFHYKTDTQTPVVGRMGEIKFAIAECLCRMYPQDLMRVGIELNCFQDEYGTDLIAANGLRLAADMESGKIQSALDELAEEGKIDAYEKERDGEQRMHYAAKADGSATYNRPSLRLVRKGAAPDRQIRSGQNDTLPEADLAPHRVDLAIPECEDDRNEFKETFSVPAKDTKANKSNEIKKEVAIAVAAFANAEGGRLFIGVNDGGKPVGLKKDLKVYKSLDGLQSAIRNSVMEHLGVLVDMKFGSSGEQYLVIEIPARKPRWVYVNSDFHVRYGNTSPRLNTQKAAEYQKEHG